MKKQLASVFSLFFRFSSSSCGTLLEAFYASGCVDNLFVTCEEWVAFTADFNRNGRHGGANFENSSASAGSHSLYVIFWMYIFFHC